jgi:hypothetical protein
MKILEGRMSLIPEMNLDEFKSMNEDEIRAMPSFILLDGGGNYLATLIVPQTDYIKLKVEYIGEMSNGVKPKG